MMSREINKKREKEVAMRRSVIAVVALVFALGLVGMSIAEVKDGKLSLKVGDEAFVCGCGAGCDCHTISQKAGTCPCGRELVKAKVSKVGEGTATFMVGGEERVLKTVGKYACACGDGCTCDTISQKPGQCACGKDLKEVK